VSRRLVAVVAVFIIGLTGGCGGYWAPYPDDGAESGVTSVGEDAITITLPMETGQLPYTFTEPR
jgi:hypothetical protein